MGVQTLEEGAGSAGQEGLLLCTQGGLGWGGPGRQVTGAVSAPGQGWGF